ncbi:hypothetical protein VZ95_05405 [Elstera litoralis]|uniref:Cytochrome C oxidase subunit I n=1 Tax=Elstera litoralis TaxID=552518 RepID=A0A0F3IUE0_9PROT|nr:DUF2189 domain-containing protein [Elstera litoralis]KJV10365.1 hypothetical protein VZ95_05405 [Elstera litoralis]
MTDSLPNFSPVARHIQAVPIDQPWVWLAAGWQDLRRAGPMSLAYGGAIFVLSLLLTFVLFEVDLPFLLLPMLAGFALVAPLMAAGLYEISRRLENGLPIGLSVGFDGIARNPSQFGLMGVLLLLIHLAWIRVATLLFALFYGMREVSITSLLDFLLNPSLSLTFLVVGTGLGATLAVIAFAVSCIAIPMLMDRDVNIVTAVATSVMAVRLNWPAMALWAGLIAFATAVSIATFYLGFILLMPLVGHATWHAYRDLVRPTP